MQFFHVIQEQFPYSKMKDVQIRDGAAVSFKHLQYTFLSGRGVEPPRCLLPETFDGQWQRFLRFCQALENGVVGEVHFTDGRPVLVLMQQDGMDLSELAAQGTRSKGGEIRERQLVAA
mgnify:CR=1 FL=1